MTVGPDPENVNIDVVDQAAARAAARLRAADQPSPFSEQGFDALERSISEYIRSLVLESSRVARRQESDVVSASDVARAGNYLFRGGSRGISQHVGTSGGVLLGAAVSNGLALMAADKPSPLSIGVTLALVMVGTFMIAFYIARDLR